MSEQENIITQHGYLAIGDSKADAVRRMRRAVPTLTLRQALDLVDLVRGRVEMAKLDFFASV